MRTYQNEWKQTHHKLANDGVSKLFATKEIEMKHANLPPKHT